MTRNSGIAWIAGVGASAGLGAALARRFARGSFKVALTGRSPERLGAIADEIRTDGHEAVVLPGDISIAEDARRLESEIEALGPLSAAIFNAGNAMRGTLLEITPEQFESAWRASAYAGFLFTQAALPQLLKSGAGSL